MIGSKVSLKCRKYKVLGNNLATFLELQKSFQSEQILFSSIFNIFEFPGRWDFGEKKITKPKKFKFPQSDSDNIVLPDVWMSDGTNGSVFEALFLSKWLILHPLLPPGASFKCNITAGLFNFNFLKSWKLIFSSGFNSFAECKGLYFYEHWWLGHLFCFFVTFKPGTRRHPWLDFTK